MPKFLQSEAFLTGWCVAWAAAFLLMFSGVLK